MGNYCCIASKHRQHKSSIRKLQKGKSINKYIESDIHKHKSSLYNADLPTKSRGQQRSGDLLNGIDSTSSLLLLSSSSTTSSSLNEPSVARRDNSQIINHLNNKSHTITQSAKSKSQFTSAVKFNQVLIESPLVMRVDDHDSTDLMKCPQRNDLYNINEDYDESDEHLKRTTDLITPNMNPNSVSNTSTSLLLTKSVNSKKLSNRKRSSYLNQSLNETDRDLMKNYNYVGRRLLDDSLTVDEDLDASTQNVEHKKQQTTQTEALNLFNWKNYRSLQKSKRSIKNLEETIQSSRSIEQWLNDFSKLKLFGDKHKDNHKSLNSITNNNNNANKQQDDKLSDQKRKQKRSRTSLDENDEKYLEEEEETSEKVCKQQASLDSDSDEFDSLVRCSDSSLTQLLNELEKLWRKNSSSQVFKLVDSIRHKLKLKDTISANEKEMSSRLSELLLPRSLANSDDIDLLKWLLSNFHLKLVGLDTELTYSSDHLVYGTQTNADYLLVANRLNIELDDLVQAQDQDLDLVVESLIEKLDSLKTTRLDRDLNVYFKYDPLSGKLKLEKNLVEKLLNKEKEIVNKLSQLNSGILLQDALISSSSTSSTTTTSSSSNASSHESLTKQQQESLNILDKYKKFILETANFKGAQHLMNIKKKQILNQKTNQQTPSSAALTNSTRTNLSSSQKVNLKQNNKKSSSKSKQTRLIMKSSTNEQYLTPTPLVCTPISDNSSGTTSPSSSSSVSPASSLSSSSYTNNNNNNINTNDKPVIPISNPTPQTISSSSSSTASTPASSGILLMSTQTPTHAATHQHDYSITYNDLNERLFSCLLSNFSCKLVDQFLATQLNTGFIRKHKQNKSFNYITIRNNLNESELMNESAGSGSGSHTDKINRLDLSIDKQLIQLCLRLSAWPQAYHESYFKRKRINLKWPARQVLDFIEKKTCLITSNSSDSSCWQINTRLAEVYLFKSLPELKQFQFYFLYFVLMNVQIHLSDVTKQLVNNKCSKLSMSQLVSERMLKQHFMRFVEIENEDDTNSNKQANQCFINMVNSLKKFLNYLKFVLDKYKTFNAPNLFDLNQSILSHAEYMSFLSKTISNNSSEDDLFQLIASDLVSALNQFDTVLNNSLIVKLNTKKTSLTNNVSLFNSFLDLIQFKRSNNDLEMHFMPAHYSAENYLYEYVYEFVAALFEQFKSKRDNFQISEQLMMELHDSILASKKMFLEENNHDEDNHFLNAIQHVNRDCLFEKFEEYAECVHKYLPQIRHNHQYLLFHYIWTMQVQYMAPFFNYLCDFYSIID